MGCRISYMSGTRRRSVAAGPQKRGNDFWISWTSGSGRLTSPTPRQISRRSQQRILNPSVVLLRHRRVKFWLHPLPEFCLSGFPIPLPILLPASLDKYIHIYVPFGVHTPFFHHHIFHSKTFFTPPSPSSYCLLRHPWPTQWRSNNSRARSPPTLLLAIPVK